MATSSSNEGLNTSYFDHFTCNICFGVLREPVQCARNEHYFCKSCITQHLTRSQTCPVCQDHLTTTTLRPASRVVANLLQQFQSPRCRYANRGCTASVRHEVLLSHHEECGFAPVQCSNDGCEETVNRQDLASHERESCDFRQVTCEECQEQMNHRQYGKHPCVFRKEIDLNRNGLVEIHKILRKMQEEQLRLRQDLEMCLLTQGLEQLNTTPRRQEGDLRNQGSVVSSPNTTQRQHDGAVANLSSQVQIQPAVRDRQFVVAGGRDKSYEVFNWSTQQWTLYENALFFHHSDGFSFVYDNKIMICGGTNTNRVECLDMTNLRSASVLPMSLPSTDCGKGVLYEDTILTFGERVSTTDLKPPYQTVGQWSCYYLGGSPKILSSYGVACVNENAVVIVGGYKIFSNNSSELTDTVRIYNPNTRQLKQLAPLPYKLADMAVLAYNDDVIILGGETECGGMKNDVLVYNLTSQQCSRLPSMLKARSKCAAVIMGDKIIAIGGASYGRYVDVTEYLVLGQSTWKELPAMKVYRSGATACVLP